MKRSIFVLILLILVYYQSDFFSVASISAPLLEEVSQPLSEDVINALAQSYHYLGKGRQAYAFESADGQWVLKFFNQKYFKIPFWAALFPKEKTKREKRRKFYLDSYRIASSMLKEETGIVYLHQAFNLSLLPHLRVTDQRGYSRRIDLNQVPFVLQKRVDPLYSSLEELSSRQLEEAIHQFLSLIAYRIDLKISDADHDIEHNFGMLHGQIIHLDPGRLSFDEALWDPEKLKHEWWSSTHRFRKWLAQHHPDQMEMFDHTIEANLQRVSQRAQLDKNLFEEDVQ